MARIAWIADADAGAELAALYATAKGLSPTGQVSDIIRCFSQRPDFLAGILQAERLHFGDGALTRAQHEMIATHVAAINATAFCLVCHASFLELEGRRYEATAHALRDGDLDAATISPAERLLLEFVATVTRHAHRVTDTQVQALREAGWTDAQVAETVYDTALFNLFTRVADAFDIHPPAGMEPAATPKALLGKDGPVATA